MKYSWTRAFNVTRKLKRVLLSLLCERSRKRIRAFQLTERSKKETALKFPHSIGLPPFRAARLLEADLGDQFGVTARRIASQSYPA